MFTGIVTHIGTVSSVVRRDSGIRMRIETAGPALSEVGESVSVAGVCLTVVEFDAGGFETDLSTETLACSTLGSLREGDRVNLERALAVGDRLGGHLVFGHVDATGRVAVIAPLGAGASFTIEVPEHLHRYLAPKGSLCVDGVSLTVAGVSPAGVAIAVIPHTMAATTLGSCAVGSAVNVELDMLARYVVSALARHTAPSRIDEALLRRSGFIA